METGANNYREAWMRKVVACAFLSLDGVMQAPGGPDEDRDGGFSFGGWTVPLFDEELGGAISELYGQPFDLLLGRKTYEIFAAHWPTVGARGQEMGMDPGEIALARAINGAVKYVATRSLTSLHWENSQILVGDVAERVRELKQGEGPMLLLQGSSKLAQTLLSAGLVDELKLIIFPVVLGQGKRFFDGQAMPAEFTRTDVVISPAGGIAATYRRAGEVRTGSFAL